MGIGLALDLLGGAAAGADSSALTLGIDAPLTVPLGMLLSGGTGAARIQRVSGSTEMYSGTIDPFRRNRRTRREPDTTPATAAHPSTQSRLRNHRRSGTVADSIHADMQAHPGRPSLHWQPCGSCCSTSLSPRDTALSGRIRTAASISAPPPRRADSQIGIHTTEQRSDSLTIRSRSLRRGYEPVIVCGDMELVG